MSTLNLDEGAEVDPTTIEAVTFTKGGSKIDEGVITTTASGYEDLTAPEDVLVVRLNDGSEFAVRGDKAQRAFDLLKRAQNEQGLSYTLTMNEKR